MTRSFEELRSKMSPERRARSEALATKHLAAIRLAELRETLGVTQNDLAERLSVAQSSVSRLESRNDMLVSTLRDAVAALGGELRVLADFPEGSIEIAVRTDSAAKAAAR